MPDTPRLSDRSDNKLQAVLHQGWPDPADGLGGDYWQACAAWFAGLSERNKTIAARAR